MDPRPSPRRHPGSGVDGLDPGSPFLRQRGIECGLTKHRLDGPRYTRIFGSVRLDADVELTPRRRAEAALLVVPGAHVSHHTAAALWGGVTPDTPLTHVSVLDGSRRRSRGGIVCHVSRAARTTRLAGVLLTTPSQTFCDLADELSLVDLVVLGDSLVRQGVVTAQALVDHAAQLRGGGAARARAAADLVRPGVDSPMETRVRLMLVLAGLPEPVVQHPVGDERRSYRLDLAWPELMLAVEYDGRQHAEDSRQWGHDLARREWLDAHGWRLLVLRAADVYDDPWGTIMRIVAAMAARGYERTTTRPGPRFLEHFPGRPWRRSVS